MVDVTTPAQYSRLRLDRTVLAEPAIGLRAVVMVALAALVFAWQLRNGFFASELAGTSDESAHFTTGVLVFDYLRRGLGESPLEFARMFYQQYPKVALGHWPPIFYALQAAWYVPFGPQPWSLVLLLGVITVATACVLLHTVSIRHGLLFGVISVALFLANPVVRESTVQANSDMLLALVSCGAMYALTRFIDGGTVRDAVRYTVWVALAVSTKWNGLALMLTLPLAVVFARRFALLKNRTAWMVLVAAGGMLLLVASAAIAFRLTGFGSGPEAVWRLLEIALHPSTRLYVVREAVLLCPPVVLSLAATGAFVALVGNRVDPRSRTMAAVHLAWFTGVIVFHVISPITGASRYLLPALFAAHVLFGAGAAQVVSWFPRWGTLLVIGAAGANAFFIVGPDVVLRSGFADAARALPTHADGPTVVLIASDSVGEGAFTAERLAHDPVRESFVLRGFKAFADDDWHGASYRLRMATAAAVRAYLHQVPVNFVVIETAPQTKAPAHVQLLADALRSAPSEFVPYGTFPLRVGNHIVPDALVVYRNATDPPADAAHLRAVLPGPRVLTE